MNKIITAILGKKRKRVYVEKHIVVVVLNQTLPEYFNKNIKLDPKVEMGEKWPKYCFISDFTFFLGMNM